MSNQFNDPHNRFYLLTPGDASDSTSTPQYAGMSVNEDGFFQYFIKDLDYAHTSVEILSPFIGQRYKMLIETLYKAVRNGVTTVVYTKPIHEQEPWMQRTDSFAPP